MTILAYILLLPGGIYLSYLFLVRLGLGSWKVFLGSPVYPEVTVLVCARNEAANLPALLADLEQLDYPAGWQCWVLDDHSEDDTFKIAEEWAVSRSQFHVLQPSGTGKKEMLSEVIANVSSPWVVTLDADTRINPHWLTALLAENEKAAMICGPIKMEDKGTFFSKVQALESAGLVGVGAGSLGAGLPSMCNGANLAYRKAAFEAVEGYSGNLHLPSGDDEFLMHKIARHFPGKVRYELREEAVVCVQPQPTLKQLWEQRKRWVSKSRKYSNGLVTWIMIAAWLFNAGMLVLLGLSLWSGNWGAFLGLFLVKILTELLVLWPMTTVFGQRKLLWIFVPEQLLHMLYVVSIGLAGNLGKYEWKGRTFDSRHGRG